MRDSLREPPPRAKPFGPSGRSGHFARAAGGATGAQHVGVRPRQLASQVLLLQVAVIAAIVLASALISYSLVSQQVTEEYEKRSLAIGHSVAAMPDVIEAFADQQPSAVIQPIAEAIRKSEAASFVVVANTDGIRYSHPNPEQIGQRVSTDPSPALQGQSWVGIEQGTLGWSVRAKVPIFGAHGEVIGIVSVGFLEDQVNASVLQWIPVIGGNVALALGLGIAGSLLLARRLKRQTFGLQPSDIAALRELDGVRSLAHALRAQAHEFSNKLHTVAGLIELGRADEAVRFITRTALVHQELVDLVHERIGDPALAALLLAKAAIANERGVEFRLAGETRLPADAADARDLVTVVGNLVDNAVDAVAGSPTAGWVEVAVQAGPEGVGVRVRDSGPGIGSALGEEIFEEGFTTKTGTSHQGLGLALARQVAQRRGGWLRVNNEGGAVFTALLPSDAAVTR